MPHLQSYANKGLAELRSGGKTFPASAVEIYAASVAEHVSELDMSIRQFGVDTEGIDVDELARHHFSQGSTEIALTIAGLVEALRVLLDALAPLFATAAARDDKDRKKSAPEGADQA